MSSMWSAVASAASATVSKLVTASAGLPFETGDEVSSFAGKSPWRLYHGKKEGVPVSLFLFHMKEKKSERELSTARNAMRRLRIIKHPYLLKCLDAGELNVDGKGNGTLYVVTEPVQPLEEVLASLHESPASLAWGVYTLAAAINFLNADCKSVHGQISLAAIFVDRGMDWKLGGFELLGEAERADDAYFSMCREVLPKRYQSPELARGNTEVLMKLPVAADWWALGCTVFEIFCGQIRSPADLKNIDEMPEILRPDYMRMLSSNPAGRLRPVELLSNPLFEEDYVSLHLFLETLNVKDSVEKDRFFNKLTERIPALPKAAAQWKVLPALVNSLEYGGGSARALEPLLKIAQVLTEEEMQAQVVPTIVKLFANPDRAMRIPLLERLPVLVPHISTRLLNDSVFQHVAMGFVDTSPVLRELTVKAMVPLAPKLLPRSMQQVMRAFAKLQLDEESAIRTNTTICLGKIAAYIDPSTREKVLIPACCRALKDPFGPGRCAALMSLTATQQYHKPIDVATKIFPSVAPCALDPEREVRETAMQCLRVYMSVIERAAASVGKPPSEQPEAAGAKDELSLAADKMLDSMSWLTSSLKSAVGGAHSPAAAAAAGGGGGGGGGGGKGGGGAAAGGGAAGAAGGGAAGAAGGGGYGTAKPAAYSPPSLPAAAPAAAPRAPAAAPLQPKPPPPPPAAAPRAESGWDDDDDALNEAFSMAAVGGGGGGGGGGGIGGGGIGGGGICGGGIGGGGGGGGMAGRTSSDDLFGGLGVMPAAPMGKPNAPTAAPMGGGAMGMMGGSGMSIGGMGASGSGMGGMGGGGMGAMGAMGGSGSGMGGMGGMGMGGSGMAAMGAMGGSGSGMGGMGGSGMGAMGTMGGSGSGMGGMGGMGGVGGMGGMGMASGMGAPMGGAGAAKPSGMSMPTLAPPPKASNSLGADPFASLGMAAPAPVSKSADDLDPFAMLANPTAQRTKKPTATKTNPTDWDNW